uniref:Uncharacterized protein n=1 Tax=Brassica oleracea var. oleracea TaxID=109376 RepID=A0A0D3CLF9_BRAOL
MENYVAGNYGKVYLADGLPLDIVGIGDINLKMSDGRVWKITKVRHVPKLMRNMISVGQLDDTGHDVNFGGGAWKTKLCHCMLGHMSEKGMKLVVENGALPDLKTVDHQMCESCILGKQKRKDNCKGEKGGEKKGDGKKGDGGGGDKVKSSGGGGGGGEVHHYDDGPKKGGGKSKGGAHDIDELMKQIKAGGGANKGNHNHSAKGMGGPMGQGVPIGMMGPMGHQGGGAFPAVQGLPMSGGGGYYPPPPQAMNQQQYMQMMMQQQQKQQAAAYGGYGGGHGGDMYHPMMYARPYPAVNYAHPPPMPPPHSGPYTDMFSDENPAGCSIM